MVDNLAVEWEVLIYKDRDGHNTHALRKMFYLIILLIIWWHVFLCKLWHGSMYKNYNIIWNIKYNTTLKMANNTRENGSDIK